MQRCNTEFASEGENGLRLSDAAFLGQLQHLAKSCKGESMWCLSTHQAFARHKAICRVPVGRHKICLMTIQSRDGIAVGQTNGDITTDDILGDERSDRIVHKDDGIGLFYSIQQVFYAVAGRSVTALSCRHNGFELIDFAKFCLATDEIFPFGRADDVNLVDERMLLEGFHRMQQYRFAVYLHKLLGHYGVHSFACTACQNQGYVMALFHMAHSLWCNLWQKASWR